MSEKDYAPLSAACVRALHDKIYEKRKTAALEIEKMVKEFAAVNNTGQIKRLLKVLGQDFAVSQNAHAKKGGLIGLAAIAIALGKNTETYTDELIRPILNCMVDQDLRVRYYACESLYNVVKVSRGAVLCHFPAIFNSLSKIATDPDHNVKNASELLDRLLKEIVLENTEFDLDGFIPLLRERIYTKNAFSRQFIISWISVLNSEPDLDLIRYLPEILDGLFRILDDPNLEVKKMCETILGEFLRKIKEDPSKVDFAATINILINHAQEKGDDLVQYTALTWIKEFVQLSGPSMLPCMSAIFTAVLPCLSYDTEVQRNIKETATVINYNLMKLIAVKSDLKDSSENIPTDLDLPTVVEVLSQYLLHNSIQTKVAVLKWIHDLYIKLPTKMGEFIDILFPALLQTTLVDESDQVVQQCLVVMAEVISSPENNKEGDTYYQKFIINLLTSFRENYRLLDERGSFIIRQLCVLLNAEKIYRTLAEILKKEINLKFASIMVEHLNMILLTSSELYDMRNNLKDLLTEESKSLFICLYETWCHNPVATVSLCLLTQSYNHVCDLIQLFGNLEVTVDFLIDIDKLVQLIESPIFAYLRLELLEIPTNKNLVRALYGLLMLLPQTEAFTTLRTRLSCIPGLHVHHDDHKVDIKVSKDDHRVDHKRKSLVNTIDFPVLLKHYIEIQEKHKEYKRIQRANEITFSNAQSVNM
ncbi:unnamed protein product [Phyllotreta striolata]|uniref:Protein VAC14 homolog n=1 Tax=Phyllotreta striolata TaxID=444603 RepID=A0A9N9XNK8_PHYSR|nr:unnamed protein product [Phyllotreta striolata]